METRCRRKVSKLDIDFQDVREWWCHIFKILESDIEEINLIHLKKVLPDVVIAFIKNILDSKDDRISDCNKFILTEARKMLRDTEESIVGTEKDASYSTTTKQLGLVPPIPPNPYKNFFKRRPDRAAIWRGLPLLLISQMSLVQLADFVAMNIATDFANWFQELGSTSSDSLTTQNIIDMFEIGSAVSCAGALQVVYQELTSVPNQVALATFQPQKAKRKMLFREILKDKVASTEKPKLVAFGTHVPSDMRKTPPQKNIYNKWLMCDRVKPSLESMSAVWQGITHLKSTRAYCEYIAKTKIKPPQYLIDSGMMNPETMTHEESLVSDESYDNVSKLCLATL